jgi:hypothetical protein
VLTGLLKGCLGLDDSSAVARPACVLTTCSCSFHQAAACGLTGCVVKDASVLAQVLLDMSREHLLRKDSSSIAGGRLQHVISAVVAC